MDPPPPPPPHGNTGRSRGGLPDGNYDIFIIPPHSAGSGFLYLPSLQPHRNSFLAGVGVTLLAVATWIIVFPVLRAWLSTIVASGGIGVVVLMVSMGVAGWAWGKTQMESTFSPGGGGSAGTAGTANTGPMPNSPPPHSPPPHAPPPQSPPPNPPPPNPPPPNPPPPNPPPPNPPPPNPPPPNPPPPNPPPPNPPPPNQSSSGVPPSASATPESSGPPPRPKPSWTRSTPAPGSGAANSAKTAWEKAREETRRKEEQRKKIEELRKKREEEEKERVKQREREAREREIRELREAREKREREIKAAKEAEQRAEQRARELREKISERMSERMSERVGSRPSSPTKPRHQQPSAKTEPEEDAYSFRPYDKPKAATAKSSGTSSVYSSSYAPSQSTARSTPPPSHRGPYHTKDPDKIQLKAVYSFNNTFMKLPIAQLVSGVGAVTDGLILRITTEGLFIDDDVRGVPQREWDVKAWTMKLVETVEYKGIHVVRASIRDQEGKRYVFILQEEEGWKVAVGLQRLRRGSQVRALGVSGLPLNEAKAILENMGWA